MKYLTDRHEVAKALNFGKYPVLTLNRENTKYESSYAEGCTVRVDWGADDGMYSVGTLCIDEDSKLYISSGGVCLSASFGYHDVMEMAKNANSPMVRAGQKVVVIERWPSKKTCTVRMMKVSDRINPHCQTVAELEDIN